MLGWTRPGSAARGGCAASEAGPLTQPRETKFIYLDGERACWDRADGHTQPRCAVRGDSCGVLVLVGPRHGRPPRGVAEMDTPAADEYTARRELPPYGAVVRTNRTRGIAVRSRDTRIRPRLADFRPEDHRHGC